MRSQLGALATVKARSHPAYSAGWLPMCQLGGDTNEHSTDAYKRQRFGGDALVPRILRTHWWRGDDEPVAREVWS